MEFLLEVLCEELPASHLRTGLEQLAQKICSGLGEGKIEARDVRTYGTPRRMVVVAEIAEAQADREETVTGPPKAVGIRPDGTYSPAALGFARSQKIAPESLRVITTPRGEYLGYRKATAGRPAAEILREVLPRALSTLTFPKMMRWGTGSFRFSRPIHNILCVVGGKPLEGFAFEGIAATAVTVGHRILAPAEIEVAGFDDYREKLRAAFVLVDPAERRALIEAEIAEKLAPLGARLYDDPGLLETLVDNVEHPLVVLGEFPERYLSLPIEVLATAMREGQKLFSVVVENRQAPRFVGVADAASDEMGLIRAGNERVLKARLEDARFFWDRDREVPLAERAKQLSGIVFQERLGSYADKAARLKFDAAWLAAKTGADAVKKESVEAAGLCKADLATEMVKEFPSLQGRVGGLYARQENYPTAVAQAIYEHYQPVGLDDLSPESPAGIVVSIADKLDSIVGVVGTGVQVSGSSDPFGLRRNAQGVCKVLMDRRVSLSLSKALDRALAGYGDALPRDPAEVKAWCVEFFAGRLRYLLERRGFRYDIVNAALGPGADDPYFALLRAQALDDLKGSADFEPFILMAKRVNNILKDQPAFKLNPDALVEKEERELQSAAAIVRDNVEPFLLRGEFAKAQAVIFNLRPMIDTFFEKVLVMAEDKKVRQNRLALLQFVRSLLGKVADYSQVVVEGEKSQKSLAASPRSREGF